MVELKKVMTAQKQGILNIKEANGSQALVGDMIITINQAEQIIGNLGWVEHQLNAFDIMIKTKKFATSLNKYLKDEYIINNSLVQFQNKRDSEYGRTFDRILIECPNRFSITLIYNMKNAGGTYVMYKTGMHNPVQKFRNLKGFCEYIEKYEY